MTVLEKSPLFFCLGALPCQIPAPRFPHLAARKDLDFTAVDCGGEFRLAAHLSFFARPARKIMSVLASGSVTLSDSLTVQTEEPGKFNCKPPSP